MKKNNIEEIKKKCLKLKELGIDAKFSDSGKGGCFIDLCTYDKYAKENNIKIGIEEFIETLT